MHSILIIARMVFKESVRDRLFLGLTLFLLFFLVFSVYVSSLSLGTVARFIKDFGMMGISLISLAVSILFGLFSLYREKERNELYVILNRASRPSYLLGRFLGTVLIISLFSFGTGAGIFLLTWLLGGRFAPEIFWASYTAILEFALLCAAGHLLYTLGVGFTLNSLMLLIIYFVGVSLDQAIESLTVLGRYGSKAHLALVKGLSYLIPNFALFNFRPAILHAERIAMEQMVWITLYGVFYLGALLAGSAFLFNRRDI